MRDCARRRATRSGSRASTCSPPMRWWARSSARAAAGRRGAGSSTARSARAYARVPARPRGNAILDAGSLQRVLPAGASAARRSTPAWASNFLILGRRRSTTGHPLFVGGPQIGYFYPGLTLEADVEWPGHQMRGIYSPAHPGNIFIGRGEDYAWSLTSAGTDNVDTFVETLCGSDTRYRYKGRCRTMGAVNAGSIAGDGFVRYPSTVRSSATRPSTARASRCRRSARPTGATPCG